MLNIQAMEETELLEMDYQDVLYLCDRYPAWQKLGRIIAQEQFVRAEKREDGAEMRCSRGIGARVTKLVDGDTKAVIVRLQPRRAYDRSAA